MLRPERDGETLEGKSATRGFAVCLVAALAAVHAVAWLPVPSEASKDSLNLVLLSIDTLRADHVGCYGYPFAFTPNLDRIARSGHRFSHAYTVMPTTLPSHAAMLTSLYPSQLGVRQNGDRLPEGAVTLAEVLKSRGYQTGAFVSAMPLAARYGLNQGFARYDDAGERPERPGSETVGLAQRWLRVRPMGRPFFLFVHLYEPHTPYQAPSAFRERFQAPPIAPPAYEFVPDPSIFTPATIDGTIRAYDAEIAYADSLVGSLVEELDQQGLAESTVLVVVSDHGESLQELLPRFGYAFNHGKFLYAHQLHVPLLMRLPGRLGRRGGVVHETPVSLLDLMPTVLDLLGTRAKPLMMGRSLKPLLEGAAFEPAVLFAERRRFEQPPRDFLRGQGYAALRYPWHLVVSEGQDRELFNLQADPGESQSVRPEDDPAGADLQVRVRGWHDRLSVLWVPGRPEIDRKRLEQLRSLGYVR